MYQRQATQGSDKPPQPVEKSLGYISWSLKEISEHLRKIVALMEGQPPSGNNPF